MARFPIEYEVEVERSDNRSYELLAGNRPRIMTGPPIEFGGSDAWWSPEHLLVSAVSSCFAATFFAAAERAHLPIGGYHCHAKGVLDRTESGAAFTSILLAVRVRVTAPETRRARELLEDTKKRCFVANSLKCSVDLVTEVDPS